MLKTLKKNAMALAAMAIAATSLTMMSFETSAVQTSYFYEYTSNSTNQSDIEDINNYQRSEASCEPGEHVCGVNLPTNTGNGNAPAPTEFDAVKSQLWAAEQAGSTTNPQISMKE
ncbi:hypothetical protein FAZ19_21775 [Sphingobacterium alkalisoli]|uniref:Uncharacterized protein n=2 Tax=Sphingobacterium TaxID=28453 RepID=A0A4U0NZ25_9SPHI|nr:MULTISPECIES: hypothetical protein [Sphingobacterium]TJY61527.1 hypothetical protein FAZ19_21775 [Sphingobacterium alkalisoli]TJZ60063.1 hypothetical protein FAZ15_14355 [Sphingobacterium olei]GGH29839.1 hypothetical protein GCM10011418_41450 [Sphingobacterium alkalisoli]